MTKYIRRRDFLKHSMFTGSLLLGGTALSSGAPLNPIVNNRLKIALNAYSFNQPLTDGEMNIGDVLGFCANNGFEACDLTAYYFPGYPEVPEDEFLYHIKHVAFRLGLEICGTGVRNDFTNPDANERKKNIALVKSWIVAAEKLGAPVIRIFAGPRLQDESDRPQVLEWMIKDIQQCVAFGKSHGVMVAVQNHNDFILTPQQTRDLMEGVNSDWFGLIMDTGGYRSGDPYKLISESIEYAVNWQVKEKIFVDGVEEDTDIDKLVQIIEASNYRGYLPIETLGPGDPKPKILKIYNALIAALN